MKLMFDIIDSMSNKLVNVVEKASKSNAEIELHEYLARYTTDSISNVV